ncbi:MAG: hypothetical protein Q8K98_09065 [Bacteroidota bacterium]|nr:hypothetical protein [Bacteroidota bacterium]
MLFKSRFSAFDGYSGIRNSTDNISALRLINYVELGLGTSRQSREIPLGALRKISNYKSAGGGQISNQ